MGQACLPPAPSLNGLDIAILSFVERECMMKNDVCLAWQQTQS